MTDVIPAAKLDSKKVFFFAGPHGSASTSVEKFFQRWANSGFSSGHSKSEPLKYWRWPTFDQSQGTKEYSALVKRKQDADYAGYEAQALIAISAKFAESDNGVFLGTEEFDQVGPAKMYDALPVMENIVDKLGVGPQDTRVVMNFRTPRLDQWVSLWKHSEALNGDDTYAAFVCQALQPEHSRKLRTKTRSKTSRAPSVVTPTTSAPVPVTPTASAHTTKHTTPSAPTAAHSTSAPAGSPTSPTTTTTGSGSTTKHTTPSAPSAPAVRPTSTTTTTTGSGPTTKHTAPRAPSAPAVTPTSSTNSTTTTTTGSGPTTKHTTPSAPSAPAVTPTTPTTTTTGSGSTTKHTAPRAPSATAVTPTSPTNSTTTTTTGSGPTTKHTTPSASSVVTPATSAPAPAVVPTAPTTGLAHTPKHTTPGASSVVTPATSAPAVTPVTPAAVDSVAEATSESDEEEGPAEPGEEEATSEPDDEEGSSESDEEEEATSEPDDEEGSSESDEEEEATSQLDEEQAPAESDEEQASSELDDEQASAEADEEQAPSELDEEQASTEADEEQASTEADEEEEPSDPDEEGAPFELDEEQASTESDEEEALSELDEEEAPADVSESITSAPTAATVTSAPMMAPVGTIAPKMQNHNYSKEYRNMIGAQTNPLGAALVFLEKGWSVSLFDMGGVAKLDRNVVHAIGCDVLKGTCNSDGHLSGGLEGYLPNKNQIIKDFVGLSDEESKKAEELFANRDCAYKELLEPYIASGQLEILYQDTLWEACTAPQSYYEQYLGESGTDFMLNALLSQVECDGKVLSSGMDDTAFNGADVVVEPTSGSSLSSSGVQGPSPSSSSSGVEGPSPSSSSSFVEGPSPSSSGVQGSSPSSSSSSGGVQGPSPSSSSSSGGVRGPSPSSSSSGALLPSPSSSPSDGGGFQIGGSQISYFDCVLVVALLVAVLHLVRQKFARTNEASYTEITPNPTGTYRDKESDDQEANAGGFRDDTGLDEEEVSDFAPVSHNGGAVAGGLI